MQGVLDFLFYGFFATLTMKTNYVSAGEQLCRGYNHRKLKHFKTHKGFSCKITNFEF